MDCEKVSKELAENHVEWFIGMIKPLLIEHMIHGFKHGIEWQCRAMCDLDDVSHGNPALEILKKIIADATGDSKDLQKRSWPIRADNYRKAVKVINESFKD